MAVIYGRFRKKDDILDFIIIPLKIGSSAGLSGVVFLLVYSCGYSHLVAQLSRMVDQMT